MLLPLHEQLGEQMERKEERDSMEQAEQEDADSVWGEGKTSFHEFEHIE